jgi:hypothetical protein
MMLRDFILNPRPHAAWAFTDVSDGRYMGRLEFIVRQDRHGGIDACVKARAMHCLQIWLSID